MTEEEAYSVAKIICQADSGCPVCVGGLERRMAIAFPDFDWGILVERATVEWQAHGERMWDDDYGEAKADPLFR